MYNPIEIGRIDRQIEDLQRLKANYQSMPQPINNIITTPTANTQPLFEARFTTENPSDIFVQNKTAFIDLKNGKLSIKEPDGELKEYFIILPKDEKDLKIENLEKKLKEMETRLNNYSLSAPENTQPVNNIPNEEIYPTTPIVVDNYDVIEDSKKNKRGFVDKLKFKN